jgi:hypothetical protein
MDYKLSITLIIPGLVTVIGWFILHRFSAWRDRNNKRKDLKVRYLIEAWKRLERCSNKEDYDTNEMETAIADIHLFGNLKQITLANAFVNEFAKNKVASGDELLEELRNDLRKELNIETAKSKIRYLRIKK